MAQCVLMVQGTTSDAGKSLMVAGLCRLLARKGVNVAPFKPQNMALNSAVTADGGEIGRAQALQAIAAKQAPTTDMNPILLKPESDKRAQIIVHGNALKAMDAVSYHEFKQEALRYVLESFTRLSKQHEVIVVEGAGSPAEINLRENDVANMGFAEAVDCPVLLVADIDRGGVFATIVGTLDLLAATERERIMGVVINKFRGDIALLHSGLNWLEEKVSKPVLGVMPFIPNLYLDAEDALTAEQALDDTGPQLRVCVIVFPRISNHTDFDALRLNPAIDLRYMRLDEESGFFPCDLLILPGTKNVREDLQQLFAASLHEGITRHLRYGGKLLGICGGLQMLGQQIHDPQGIESEPGSSAGLGLLEFDTTLEAQKQLQNRSGELQLAAIAAASVSGYEIHCGISEGPALARPLIRFADGHHDGVISTDSQIIGTYLHGLFDDAAASAAILQWAGLHKAEGINIEQQREQQLERLADVIEKTVDVAALFPDYFAQRSEKSSWSA